LENYEDRNYLQHSWPWWRGVLTGLNILAFVLSAILSWHYLEGESIIGCVAGSQCDNVLNSQWSAIAGVLPVSGLAMGVYLAMFAASFFISTTTEASVRRLAWSIMVLMAGSIAGSAIWFTVIQKWIVGTFCIYCMTAHITGLVLSGLVIWRAILEFKNHASNFPLKNAANARDVSKETHQNIIKPLPVLKLVAIGLFFAGILAAFQFSIIPSAVYINGKSQDNLPAVDYHDAPVAGSPDAPIIVTLLFDYQCSHCQKIHLLLDEAIRRYDSKLAFVLCPAPLNTYCNPFIPRDVDEFKNSCELVKIGLAIWVANRKMFPTFDNWMFTFESGNNWQPRSLEYAMAKAIEFVGQAKFNTAWNDPWIENYMQTCIRIYGQTIKSGNGGIPKIIYGSRWVIPEVHNADELIMVLQKTLGIPKP
jgi:uncharacterized membrane protein